MLNQVLMFGGVAMALVITVTLVVVFFMMTHGNPPRATISHLAKVIGRRKARPLPPPPDAPYALDVLRIRVPNVGFDGGVGKRDATSVLLTTEYFDMIKKMAASSSSSRP